MIKTCPHCHKEFKPSHKQRIHCSRGCKNNAAILARRKSCKVCGADFFPKHGDVGTFCSVACKDIDHTNKQIQTCRLCGRTILRSPSKAGRPFCSYACAYAARIGPGSLLWKGGLKYYRGPNWVKQSRAARKRDGACRLCGYKPRYRQAPLHVHHIVPFREFGKERYQEANELTNLISLCASCHGLVESGKVALPR